MKKKILILGGSGFIGHNLLKFLLDKKNYDIHATFNKNPISIKSTKIKKLKINLNNEESINNLFKKGKYHYVVMTAGEIFNLRSNKKNLKEKVLK